MSTLPTYVFTSILIVRLCQINSLAFPSGTSHLGHNQCTKLMVVIKCGLLIRDEMSLFFSK